MAATRITLQNRITMLMVFSAILFIAAFTLIQVNNQLSSLNRYNAYQAQLSSIIVKNNLEATIRQVSLAEQARYLQSSLTELKDSNVIQDTIVFNTEGVIVASTVPSQSGSSAAYRDINKLRQLEDLAAENKYFIPDIDTGKKIINIFMAIKYDPNGAISYVTKLSFSLGNMREALKAVYMPLIYTAVIIVFAYLLLGYILSKVVVGPIHILNEVTKLIAAGDLSVRAKISTHDELEELGATFNYMTEELVKMKEKAENANPLTKLPGNIVIHEETDKRIRENRKFMVIYCDLDNFKAFNDKYGIAKGDDAIKMTAELFKESSQLKGNADDFVGHEGGDDFILLTTPEKAQAVADHITSQFDKRVRALYDKEDLGRGFIMAHGRDGEIKKFPIMTISLAGVTNEHRRIESYGEITNIAAEIKKKAKAIEGSVFVVDKRTV